MLITSVSLAGGGNWPKLLLALSSFQVPFRLVVCAKLGSANSAAAHKVRKIFRCMDASSSLIRGSRSGCYIEAADYTPVVGLRADMLPKDANHAPKRLCCSPEQ